MAGQVTHGTYSGYSHWKCRCPECKEAVAAYQRKWATGATKRPPSSCGTTNQYRKGCRCPECKEAANEYSRKQKGHKKRVPAVCGTPSMYRRGCRCRQCTEAWAEDRRKKRGHKKRAPAVCGTKSMYNMGCRCPECTEACAEYMRKKMGYSKKLPIRCGTYTMYFKRGCRCLECLEFAANRSLNEAARTYGISEEEVKALRGIVACAICSKAINTPDNEMGNIDHCHETGQVRGMLCRGCNTGLGLLGDNLEGLKKALRYLEANVQSSVPQT